MKNHLKKNNAHVNKKKSQKILL